MSIEILFFFLCSLFCLDFIVAIDYPWQPLLNISNDTLAKAILPRYLNLNLIHDNHLSNECRMDIYRAIDALYERKTWSYKLFDSWARSIPSGMMIGTFTDFGDFDQCMSIDSSDIVSKYCILDMSIAMPEPVPFPFHLKKRLPVLKNHSKLNGTIFNHLADKSSLFYYIHLWMGICVPESCSLKDIQYAFNTTGINEFGFQLNSLPCKINENDQNWKLNFVQLIALIVIVIMLSINIISIIYENFIQNENDSMFKTIMKWFSPIKNSINLSKSSKQNELSCIHGIRFISMVWIVTSHAIKWNPWNFFRQSFALTDEYTSLILQPKFNGHYSTETFFYISGLLASFSTYKKTKGDYKKFNYISFILMRYLRLTPQIIVYMLLISLIPFLSDGPIFSIHSESIINKCSTTWWHNLFYIQNLLNPNEICALHTWFLAADMQLHIMSALLIRLLLRNSRKGIFIINVFIIIFFLISSIIIYIQKLSPGFILPIFNDFIHPNYEMGYLTVFFFKPWIHVIVFFIGLIAGAYLQKCSSPMVMKTSNKYLFWLLVFLGYLFCIFYTIPWFDGHLPINPLWSAILFPLSRIIWAIVLTLIVWLCVTNNGIFIGRFLSWPLFRPLSRLSYSVYLTHELVLMFCIKSRRNLINYRTNAINMLFASIIVFSYMAGYIFTIIFECPSINCLNYLKSNRTIRTNKKSTK
uniref:Nose resistant to fluoxetine protein 6-like n=1 Tax=Dermatophagoides pteronyssinus TaxID=6956 RepID=A0A6P6XTZ7_DERPT|nr:nose resistant to fluoxetine protein 6-like [Dermatophagoides pteronyssinus]